MTLRKTVTQANCSGSRLLDGLCPDEASAFMEAMNAKSDKILKKAERLRDLIQDLKLVHSVIGRTDFVQELDNAAATQTKMVFLVCTWTAMIFHSNPATWHATSAGRASLASLKSVVTSVDAAPDMLAMERQLDTAIWKQLRVDLKMPAPSEAQAPAPATASGQLTGQSDPTSGQNMLAPPSGPAALAAAAVAPASASGPEVLAAAAAALPSAPTPATAPASDDDTLNLLAALGGDDPSDAAVASAPASGPEVLAAAAALPSASTLAAAPASGLGGDDLSDAAVDSAPASGPEQLAPPAADIASQETVPGAPITRSPEVVQLDADAAAETLVDVSPPQSPAVEIRRDPAADNTAECEEAARIVAAASTASGPNGPPAVIVAQLARWGRRPAQVAAQDPALLATVSIEQGAPEIAGDPQVGPPALAAQVGAGTTTASGRQVPAAPAEQPDKRRRLWAPTAFKSAPVTPPASMPAPPASQQASVLGAVPPASMPPPAPPASAPPTTGAKRRRTIKQIEGQAALAMYAAVPSPAPAPKPVPAVVPAAVALPPPPVRAASAAPAITASGQPEPKSKSKSGTSPATGDPGKATHKGRGKAKDKAQPKPSLLARVGAASAAYRAANAEQAPGADME